jgi:hypothetical protein
MMAKRGRGRSSVTATASAAFGFRVLEFALRPMTESSWG